jgi:hypothetical protein
VSSREKLLAAIRNNPKDVRLDDACKVAGWLGFDRKGGKGRHRAFHRSGEPVGLNFQADRNGTNDPGISGEAADRDDR